MGEGRPTRRAGKSPASVLARWELREVASRGLERGPTFSEPPVDTWEGMYIPQGKCESPMESTEPPKFFC